jgi:hypothetical protein
MIHEKPEAKNLVTLSLERDIVTGFFEFRFQVFFMMQLCPVPGYTI